MNRQSVRGAGGTTIRLQHDATAAVAQRVCSVGVHHIMPAGCYTPLRWQTYRNQLVLVEHVVRLLLHAQGLGAAEGA